MKSYLLLLLNLTLINCFIINNINYKTLLYKNSRVLYLSKYKNNQLNNTNDNWKKNLGKELLYAKRSIGVPDYVENIKQALNTKTFKNKSIIKNNTSGIFFSNYNNNLNITDLSNKLIFNKKIPNILRYTINNFSLKDSELKHSRIAMLAIIGRISAESIHPILANKLYSENLLVNNELVPSIFNGGLNKIHPIFYIFTLLYIFLIELNSLISISDLTNTKKNNTNNISPFDPLNIYNSKSDIDKRFIQYNEINIGRLSMVISTWFTYYEFVTQKNVINPELSSLYPWVILIIINSLYT
jgi:hypothetical protein|tara:strand:- start:947 stop:1843 length:897 start_codon:yes stop_codon:yes gene_type:complete